MFTWAGAIKALSEILNRIADYVDEYRRKQEAKEAQKERDNLHDNPAGWFKQHFGVRGEKSKDAGSDKTNN